MALHNSYTWANVGSPLQFEMVMNFGVVGMLMVFGALGYIASRVDLRYQRLAPSGIGTVIGLAIPIIAVYQVVLLRGALMGTGGKLLVLLLLIGCLSWRVPRVQTDGSSLGSAAVTARRWTTSLTLRDWPTSQGPR